MADISFTGRNFNPPYLLVNGTRKINFSFHAILRAIITLGAQRYTDVLNSGWPKFLYRFGMGIATLAFLEPRTEGLCLAQSFSSLDMSEKMVASYWYGMTFAKLIAESELGVPWVAHVDQMIEAGVATTSPRDKKRNPKKEKRADFIGRDTNQSWHVIEAKGRTNSYTSTDVTNAKKQSAKIKIIGNNPSTTSACITSLWKKPISILLDDPEPDKEDYESLEISETGFFTSYYKPIIEYIRLFGNGHKRTVGNQEFRTAPLLFFFPELYLVNTKFELELGLLESIFNNPEKAPSVVIDLQKTKKNNIGNDGIAIFGQIPDWTFDNET